MSTANIEWKIPPSVLEHLEAVPKDQPVALLLRHSVRDELPPGDAGYVLPITAAGVAIATELGRVLGERLKTLHTSPLVRCVQTAQALRQGAGCKLTIVEDRLLGDPGAFVLDGSKAGVHWEQLGHEAVMSHIVTCEEPLEGFARPREAARYLVQHMLHVAGAEPGVHVFVSHDSLITAAASRLLERPLFMDSWPWYLEGAFFWERDARLHLAYREHTRHDITTPLCGLRTHDVIEFARREISTVVGFDCPARFFLAGGAFKTLLTGRAPRDLDLWAPSEKDRALLVERLEQRGTRCKGASPFADAWQVGARVVEVPHKVEPETLEDRLSRFDIGLSAVGVEHSGAGAWRAVIHPLAEESVRRKEVLLLKPLVNPKYALTTLERARRYAAELDFTLTPEEEAVVWQLFEGASQEMQQQMWEHYLQTGHQTHGVAEEASCRRR
jgi:broad specificity phosphatase PhoE